MNEIVESEVSPVNTEWKYMDVKDCKLHICSKCERKTSFHPNYISCVAGGCVICEKIEDICKRMLKCRGYQFISIERNSNKIYIIKFKCSEGHVHSQNWGNLRRGRGCQECNRKKKEVKVRVEKTKCNCKESNKGKYVGSAYVCEHYNFAVMCPDAFKNWWFPLNQNINPYKTAPGANIKAFFKCDKYNEIYSQILNDIFCGHGCKFCSGSDVCLGNSLYTTHPEICKTWNPNNNLKTTEVTAGSHTSLSWLCDKGIKEHDYERTVYAQVNHKGRCPKCAEGYEQRVGGHKEFVRVAREVHGDKYEYPEEMTRADIKININCPVVSKYTGFVHGLFTKSPSKHKAGEGCPKCSAENELSVGARTIKDFLTKWGFIKDIHYFTEHKIEGLVHKTQLRLDFYIKNNICGNINPIAMEFDGRFHFADYGRESCVDTQKRDLSKDLFCVANKINLLRIPHTITLTEKYLADLLNKCMGPNIYYCSYSHYENVIRKRTDFRDVITQIVYLPPCYQNINCEF